MTKFNLPIEPSDIKVGDRVRPTTTKGMSGVTETYEFVVGKVGDEYVTALKDDGNLGAEFSHAWGTWGLTERKPVRVGSTWRHPSSGLEYVVDSNGRYHPYNTQNHQAFGVLNPNYPNDLQVIARLEMLFKGPWRPGED